MLAGCAAGVLAAGALPGAVAFASTPTPVLVSECSSASALRSAIEDNTDVAVMFSCSGTIPITSPLVVAAGHSVSINGGGQSVALDGGGASRILSVEGGDLILSHLALQEGRASGAPGIGALKEAPFPWPAAPAGESSTNPAVAGTDGANGVNGQPGGEGGSGQGGALYIATGSIVEVNDVAFAKDLAAGGNGGLGLYGEDGGSAGKGASGTEAHPDGSAGGNSGSGGEGGSGGAGGAGQGGAIYNAGTLSVLNSSFSEDEAAGGAGGRGGYGAEPGPMPANSEKPAPNGGDGYSFRLNGQLDLPGGSGGFGGDSGNQGDGGNGGGGGAGQGGAIYNAGGLSVTNTSFSADTASGASGGNGQAPFTGGVIRGGDGGEGGTSIPGKYEEDAMGGGGGEGGQAGNGGNAGNGGAGGAGGSGVGGAIASNASLTVSTNTFASDAVSAGSGGNGGNPGEAGCGGWGGIGGITNAVVYVNHEYLQLNVFSYTANYFHEPKGYDCFETVSGYQPAGGAGGVPGSGTPEGEPGSNPHAVIEPNVPAQPGKAKAEPQAEPPYSICDPRDGQLDCLPGTTGADGHAGVDGLGGHGGAAGSVASPVDVVDTLGSAPAIQTAVLPGAQAGTPYEATLTASGGTPPYKWELSSGALPAGLALSSAGVIAGTPATAETASFTVSLSDSSTPPRTAMQSLSLTVSVAGEPTPKSEPTPIAILSNLATGSGSSASTGSTPVSAGTPSGVTGALRPGVVKKPLTLAQKLAGAVKACHKLKNAKKRTSCIVAAKKRYPLGKPKAKPKHKQK